MKFKRAPKHKAWDFDVVLSNSSGTLQYSRQNSNPAKPRALLSPVVSGAARKHRKEKDPGQAAVKGTQKSSLLHLSTSMSILLIRIVKRRRANDEDESNKSPKLPRHAQETESRAATDNWSLVEDRSEDSWSRRSRTVSAGPDPVLPSPGNTFESAASTSTASVQDLDYRQSVRYRDIFIKSEDPPPELMRSAQTLISRSRSSPEIDDANIKSLMKASQEMLDNAGDQITQQMVPNTKPDLAFGYPEAAFTDVQLGTIDLLFDDRSGRSHAVPESTTRFPFLQVEYRALSNERPYYTTTNQAAGAGAIALNDIVKLMERSFGLEHFDYDKPQYFSIGIDHQLARLSVHWVKAPTEEGGQHSFHQTELAQYYLHLDANSIRAFSRAIKNIVDDGADPRLPALCDALDRYREVIVRDEEAGNAQQNQRHDGPVEPRDARERSETLPLLDPLEAVDPSEAVDPLEAGGGASDEEEDRTLEATQPYGRLKNLLARRYPDSILLDVSESDKFDG
ncbi:hypothetical protein LTR41_011086 [Exophiala xenobiotica]|nr:hypothetical protein LTR41_011086 [Exophiala xenobiotica]